MAGVLYYELVVERASAAKRGQPAEPVEEEIAEILLFFGIPTALLTVLGGSMLLRKTLAPLGKLAAAAENLHIHNLHEPLPRTGNGDELDRLAQVLNATNRRLEEAFRRVQEFTLHASHELKTPLAILRAEIETQLNDPAAPAPQREAFANQLDEIQRLTQIVEGLIFLAKADSGTVALAIEKVSLDDLVREAYADAQVLARPGGIGVRLGACDPSVIDGDRHRLRQLLLNLTDNAIKYNQPGGSVTIALCRKDGAAELTVTNSGPGIAPAHLSRVFDRFFRGGESHHGAADGCGLGLSIVQWIVKAHGAEITARSQLRGETAFQVRFALAT